MQAISEFNDRHIKGKITFIQNKDYVSVIIKLHSNKYKNSTHGIHVHEKPITAALLNSKNCCDSLGGHFNPTQQNHGNHIGDLCHNITFDSYGNVFKEYNDHRISLEPGSPYCIVGRSIIIHEDPDDCGNWFLQFPSINRMRESLITGNAGKRIACSNIIRIPYH